MIFSRIVVLTTSRLDREGYSTLSQTTEEVVVRVADLSGLNQLIWSMGLKFRTTVVQRQYPAQPHVPTAVAFPLAAAHLFLTLPAVVQRILKRTTPEDIAHRGRQLGSMISPRAIWMFGYHFLVGREVLIDEGQVYADGHADEIGLVLDFWRRLAFAHREDGRLDNSDAGCANIFLPSPLVYQLYDALIPVDSVIRRRLEQFLPVLHEYQRSLHSGAQIGLVDSGPYPLNVERVLIIRDCPDLKGAYYPWRDVVTEVPYQTCALAMTFDAEDFQTLEISDQSELHTLPAAYVKAIREIALVGGEYNGLQVLPITEMEWLTRTMKKAQPKLESWFAHRTPQQIVTDSSLSWSVPPFALLSSEEVHRASTFSPTVEQLTALYLQEPSRAGRWLAQRCLAPGNVSAFVPLG